MELVETEFQRIAPLQLIGFLKMRVKTRNYNVIAPSEVVRSMKEPQVLHLKTRHEAV